MSPTERPPQEGKADLIVSGAGMAWDKMEGLKADGEVTDLGELFEELQCMFRDVKVEALVQVDGPQDDRERLHCPRPRQVPHASRRHWPAHPATAGGAADGLLAT